MTTQSYATASVKPLLYAVTGTVLLAIGGMSFLHLDVAGAVARR